MRWQGFALGFLALVGFEAVVSNTNGVAAFGGIATGAGNLAQKVISPLVPAFVTHASTSAATSSAPTPTAASLAPTAAAAPTLAPLPASTSSATIPAYVGPYPAL